MPAPVSTRSYCCTAPVGHVFINAGSLTWGDRAGTRLRCRAAGEWRVLTR
jgi:hypothetical protein